MKRVLNVLHLEDDPHDSDLMSATLAADGIAADIVRVETRDQFVARLADPRFDLVISDLSLPAFDGITAQAIWQEMRPAIPFIFLSGTLGEDVAIARLREGATDYVLKSWLDKLPSVVRRALSEAEERTARRAAQDDLARLNIELESRVQERTAQLSTANRALVDSERRFSDILDRSPAAISLKDLDGRYVFVNRRFQETMGTPRREAIGKRDSDILPAALAAEVRANDLRVLDSGATLDFEEQGPPFGGMSRVFHSSKFLLTDSGGQPYALCTISTDITERKQGELAMAAARREAERANRAKSEFLSRMSHDLRTPLNAVLGFAQLLDMDNLSPDQRESVSQILEAGRHLLDLMNEVLDISRIESGNLSLSPEPVAVADIVEHLGRLVRPLAAARNVEVVVTPSAREEHHVRADRQRLNQILLNLMSNAIKYNRVGGSVTVSCEPIDGRRLRINVADTGAGIRPEKLALLFTPFERLGAEQSGIEGTGLGLALSRGLAEAMGGTVDVESEVDRGSTFWVELHATVPDVALAADDAAAPADASAVTIGGTILYIEDNASNVRLVERVLRQRRPGITLLNACDGARGIEMAAACQPDLIFLDLHLPDTPGEDVLRSLWEDRRTRSIPVAVLSADATMGKSRRLLAAGARAYLTKPLEVPRVLALVDETLKHKRAAAPDTEPHA